MVQTLVLGQLGLSFREEVKVQGLESNASAGVFETHRQDAAVDLVKLHQLQQICKQCDAIIHSAEDSFLHL